METVIRVAIVYAMIVLGLRVLGKREFGQLAPVELVTLLLIPEIVSQALQRQDYSLTNAAIGLGSLFSLVFLTSLLSARFPHVQKVLEGTPAVLVKDGRLIRENILKERITPDELVAEMRKSGIEDLASVRWAILETDGKISIVSRERSSRPVDSNPAL